MSVKFNGKLLRIRLAELEWTLETLSTKSGVATNTLRRMQRGEIFTSDTLGKIALALELNPVDLIDAEGYVSPHMDASPVFSG